MRRILSSTDLIGYRARCRQHHSVAKATRRTIRASFATIDSLCLWNSICANSRENSAERSERERSEKKEVDISHSFPSTFVCILDTARERAKTSFASQYNWLNTGNRWLEIDPTDTVREDNQIDCRSKLFTVDEQIYRSTRFCSNVSLSLSSFFLRAPVSFCNSLIKSTTRVSPWDGSDNLQLRLISLPSPPFPGMQKQTFSNTITQSPAGTQRLQACECIDHKKFFHINPFGLISCGFLFIRHHYPLNHDHYQRTRRVRLDPACQSPNGFVSSRRVSNVTWIE